MKWVAFGEKLPKIDRHCRETLATGFGVNYELLL